MTPSWHIHCVPHTWHNEPTQRYLTQRTQMRHRHENQWALTGTSPGDWSEEACLSMMIDGCQNENSMENKSCKMFNILHRRPRPHRTSNQTSPPWEQIQTSIQEAYDALRNKHAHTSHKGGFILPCIPFHLFHFHDMLTRALYDKCRYRYRYPAVEKNPHLFFLHHSCIGLTLSQLVETIFWSMKILNTLVTDMLV